VSFVGDGRTEVQPEQRALMVARLYHEAGLRQVEIAEMLGLSQSQISRSLKLAVDAGLVRTTVIPPAGVHAHLEDLIRDRFGLRDVLVVDALGEREEAPRALARYGAAYVEATIGADDIVGVAASDQTVMAVIHAIGRSPSRRASAVVPILGGIGAPSLQIRAARSAERLAHATGARLRLISAPGVVNTAAARRALMEDTDIRSTLQLWDRLDILLVGIGAITRSTTFGAQGGAVPPREFRQLISRGAVGDIALRYFDIRGAEVQTEISNRVLGVTSRQMRSVPLRVAVAGGVEKLHAIRAALRGKWANVLITDLAVARHLAAHAVPNPRTAPDRDVPRPDVL
jgi:DNA-binding transcriptional regulator LsrR (DeoR family)